MATKPMLFIHVPKTAGTSFREGVVEWMGLERVAFDYGPKHKKTTPFVRKFLYEEKAPVRFRQAFDRRKKRFFTGHVRLMDHVGYFDLESVAFFVRDPVQRVISEYKHFARHYKYSKGLQEFVNAPRYQNRQHHFAAGAPLERIGFVGLSERYEESLQRLNQRFGWNVPVRTENMGRKRVAEPYVVEPEIRSLILERNPLDHALYEGAVQLFDHSQLGAGPGRADRPDEHCQVSGSCQLAGRRVEGWACEVGEERARNVAILVNGKNVASVRADEFRQKLRANGIKRSGCAGFSHELEGLALDDTIRCIDQESGRELDNSPLRYPGP